MVEAASREVEGMTLVVAAVVAVVVSAAAAAAAADGGGDWHGCSVYDIVVYVDHSAGSGC
jgi:hypothetical protein